MIVAVLNQKGGVGKTTLATHIAGELALRGQHVILLDADPQGSSLDWTQRRSQQGLPRLFSAVGLARETLHQEAPELARRADHIVIDGPPRIAALARSALLAAERVLIPVPITYPTCDRLSFALASACSKALCAAWMTSAPVKIRARPTIS